MSVVVSTSLPSYARSFENDYPANDNSLTNCSNKLEKIINLLSSFSISLTSLVWSRLFFHETIDLSKYPKVTDDQLIKVIQLLRKKISEQPSPQKIRCINLKGCHRITQKGLAHLQAFPDVTTINLDGCRVTKEIILSLKTLPELINLNLGRFFSDTSYSELPSEGMNMTENLNLQHVTFGRGNYDNTMTLKENQTVKQISKWGNLPKALGEMIVDHCDFQTYVSVCLTCHSWSRFFLHDVNLSDHPYLTDDQLIKVIQELRIKGAEEQTVRSMNLDGCSKITEKSLVHLKGFSGITSLCINHCRLTKGCISALKALPRLSYLHLSKFFSCFSFHNNDIPEEETNVLEDLKNIQIEFNSTPHKNTRLKNLYRT